MSLVMMDGIQLQAALDRAAKEYKVRVGDERAWTEFYTWLDHNLGPYCSTSVGALKSVRIRLESIAKDPELLVCCGGVGTLFVGLRLILQKLFAFRTSTDL